MGSREHWVSVADRLLEAVVPYATPGFAQYRLPGRTSASGPESDGLEGFARTFLLAAFRAAGDPEAAPGGLLERYAVGLAHGTDPSHEHAWQPIADHHQTIVEAASIALALHETRELLFDRLDPAVQERVVAWLGGIVGKYAPPCNWVLFKVIVEQFLANVGGPHDPAEIQRHLADIEPWYVGDGWYTDGAGQNYDYYCGWAMHLYTLWWTRMSGADPGVYRERLRTFLETYQHLFAPDGAPMHQGRSLTYRMATVAPFWVGAIFDATPLSPGRTRLLADRTLGHFERHGTPGADGLLSLGWHRPFLPVTQPYSGPASPYWASKGFAGLLLGPDHPVWTEPAGEAGDTGEQEDLTLAMPAPGWLLHRSGGVVRLINHGSDHNNRDSSVDDPHYAKFAYSTHTAPETGDEGRAANIDGHLTVTRPDGSATRRRRIDRLVVTDRLAASRYFDGEVAVETASVVDGPWEVRVHRVAAPEGSAVRDGGHALAGDEPCATRLDGLESRVSSGALVSSITGLHGWYGARVAARTGQNAVGEHSATPYLVGDHPGGQALYAAAVWLGPGEPSTPPPPVVEPVRDGFTWKDAEGGRIEVRLGRSPGYVREHPSGERVTWTAS
ncbi:DUF2264 domain-containing protein [Nonomuraea sp. 3-1Str]|uniref:DUF2264 domain-containing protein n=1 Tax=Nonomuraea sp. 3-1Str TaxID=2929801 RepID=UPI002858C642|nr:DUF2264 domain-containing protein [Nonomuraea sp. 3-1Str]MDR8411995.1 DUF2264 domain-containing protein [Nonomuraea sp. 3-1Str]